MSDPDAAHPEPAYPPIRPEYADLTADETSRLWRAMMLAPNLEVLNALLRGEDIPVSALDPVWAKRFGLT